MDMGRDSVCPKCGGTIIGNGHTQAMHCENVTLPEDIEADAPTTYCDKKRFEFLNDIVDVCKKHGLSLSHEDGHGRFTYREYDDYYTNWLLDAYKEGK